MPDLIGPLLLPGTTATCPLFKNTCGPNLDLAPLWGRLGPQMRAPGRHLRPPPPFYAIQWHITSADDFD